MGKSSRNYHDAWMIHPFTLQQYMTWAWQPKIHQNAILINDSPLKNGGCTSQSCDFTNKSCVVTNKHHDFSGQTGSLA